MGHCYNLQRMQSHYLLVRVMMHVISGSLLVWERCCGLFRHALPRAQGIPMKRVGRLSEIANVAAFLARALRCPHSRWLSLLPPTFRRQKSVKNNDQ